MELPEVIKGFIAGLAFGGMLPVRPPQPTEVPVEQIEIAYYSDTLNLGDTMLLNCKLYPEDATHRAVDWESSDVSVASIQKINNETALLTTHNTGTIEITCRSTDGYGAYAVVKINIQQGQIFTSVSIAGVQGIPGNLSTRKAYVCFNYAPLTMDGRKLKVEIIDIASGDNTQYKVRDTAIPNIKEIETLYTSKKLKEYYSYISAHIYYIRYNIIATDGSDFRLLNQSIALGTNSQCAPASTMFGFYSSIINTLPTTLYLMVGYTILLGSSYSNTQCIYNDVEFEVVQGNEFIKIDNKSKEVTAIGVGVAIVKVRRTMVATRAATDEVMTEVEFTINCIEEIVPASGSGNFNYGLLSRNGGYFNYDVRYSITENEEVYKIVAGVGLAYKVKVDSVPVEYLELQDDNWIKFKKYGIQSLGIQGKLEKYNCQYDPNVATTSQLAYRSVDLNTLAPFHAINRINVGRAASNYISGNIKLVWTTLNVGGSNSIWGSQNGYTYNKIDCMYNADELKLLDRLYFVNTNNNTLTFTTIVGGGTSTAPIEVYVFEKLVDYNPTVTFQLHDNPNLFAKVEVNW